MEGSDFVGQRVAGIFVEADEVGILLVDHAGRADVAMVPVVFAIVATEAADIATEESIGNIR